MSGLLDRLDEWRRTLDDALRAWLPSEETEPRRLHAAMRYAVFGGGKRLRPMCCMLASSALDRDARAALPAAAALELVHTYSLVHDDLPAMDDDDLRRGRPTLHKAFDEATAILAGDGLLTLAFEVLAREPPPAVAARSVAELARASGAAGMVGGQADDLAAEGRSLDRDAVLSIDRRKTGALFEASFALGALAAEATPAQERALRDAGADLGTAFQIIDDLLDLRSSAAVLGKRAGKDRARGKATLPALLGDAEAFAEAERRTRHAADRLRTLPSPELILELAASMLSRSH